ncbi:MAG: hypothetical protein ABIW81_04080 [Terrimesophilobacter sp.]
MTVVFLHGAGNSGRTAWPVQAAEADDDWVFLNRHELGDDAGRDASRILEILGQQLGGHVVAAMTPVFGVADDPASRSRAPGSNPRGHRRLERSV